jgi:DNA polymerase-3 subunit alpha
MGVIMSEILTEQQAEQQYPGKSEFVHLHTHTLYSLLDGVASPADYFKGCADRKWPAIAITEHGMLNSIPDAYLASKEFGVKQIVACEIYYNDYEPLRQDMVVNKQKLSTLKSSKDQLEVDLASRISRNRHLTVLCKNMTGYLNLLKINKHAWEHGFYYKPRVWFDLLAQHREGLIILSGCMNGPVSHELRNNNVTTKYCDISSINSKCQITGAIEYVKKFRSIFGDDYYIELQMPGVEGDVELFWSLYEIAKNMKIKTILTNDCHYIKREHYRLQKVMMAIDQGTTIHDPELFHVNSDNQYFKTRHELRYTFSSGTYSEQVPISEFEAACDNTLEVADKCTTFKPNLDPKLPKIDNAEITLAKLAFDGLKERGLDNDTNKYVMDGQEVTYKQQIEIELNRFIEKGFASYFLITRDLIRASTDRGYPIGPARGSAGGSLICYLIGIHSINPFKWGTSFNRFLSPSRGGNMLKVNPPVPSKPQEVKK